MADHPDPAREKRARGLKTLADYPSGRQSLLSILLAKPENGSAVHFSETPQQLIDAILAIEFPEVKPAATGELT
jgi:hypothetical protein